MQGFPENSIDCIVTDPPYGLKFMGKKWDQALPPKEAFKEMCRVLKPGALAFVMSSPRQDLLARMILLLEDAGFKTDISFIDWIYKTGFPKAYDVSKGIDRKLGLEQKIIGYRKGQGNIPNLRGEWGLKSNIPVEITEPASPLAKVWAGWKSVSGLKPAHEPVLMVYKPRSERMIVDNVLRWGTGAINVDACRIPIDETVDDPRLGGKGSWITTEPQTIYGGGGGIPRGKVDSSSKGRFPANLLVSDKAIDTGEKTRSGKDVNPTKDSVKGFFGQDMPYYSKEANYGDVGDQSRYFDLDAWAVGKGFCDTPKPSKKERDVGLKSHPKKVPKSKFNLSDGSKDMRFDGVVPQKRSNIHPTVKPVKLMAYLIELGCPKDGVVLDPFVGSGTTCMAAKQLGRKYIGIEIEDKYHRIAEARVKATQSPVTSFFE